MNQKSKKFVGKETSFPAFRIVSIQAVALMKK